MEKTYIIADVGANHNRDFNTALQLIDACVDAKVDAVKFQTYSSETLYSKNTPNFDKYENIPDLIKSIELPRQWQKDLKDYCDEKNIEFLSTPFDDKAVDELVELGIKRFKIASFESTDRRFIEYVANKNLPIIFSSGLMGYKDIFDTVNWIKNRSENPDITILHCISSYPTPYDQINLNKIKGLKYHIKDKNLYRDIKIKVGFSDHTEGILAPALSVCYGVSVIEKHITLSRDQKGPDHAFAIEPHELKEMVQNIRKAELMVGEIYPGRPVCEKEMNKASRSVVALTNINKGEIITRENITTKRPFLGKEYIHARKFNCTLGKIAQVDIQEDDLIKKEWVK